MGRKEERSSQGTDQAHQRVLQSQQPAGPVSWQAHPRSRDPSSDPWNQGNLHCLLPVPSSREREENCGAKVYSKLLEEEWR